MQRRTYVLFALAAVALLAIFLISACGKTEPAGSTTLDGEALAKERCSVCHNYSRVESAKKTPEEWKTTVERMVANGAKLNADEKKTVIEYLSEAYPK